MATILKDEAYWQNLVSIATTELSNLQNALPALYTRYYDWQSLYHKQYQPAFGSPRHNSCGRKLGCTDADMSAIQNSAADYFAQLELIKNKESELETLKTNLRNEQNKSPEQKQKDIDNSLAINKANLATQNQKQIIGGIILLVLVIVIYLLYIRFRKNANTNK